MESTSNETAFMLAQKKCRDLALEVQASDTHRHAVELEISF